MSRQYSTYHRQKQYKPRFYLIIILLSLLTITGSFILGQTFQSIRLTFKEEPVNYLTFESISDISKWHNQELKFAYLTFDDGPSKNVTRILDILNHYDVKGTFFVLGSSIKNNINSEEILNRMINEGHYIAMHSMTHDYKTLYGDNGPQNFVNEMNELKELIASLTDGFQSQLCRAPYGTGGGTFKPHHIAALKAAGLKCWDWDVDSLDWKYKNAADIMPIIKQETEMKKNKQNLVILFHEKDSTIEVLPQVIEYLQDQGYEILPYNPERHFPDNFFNSNEI